MNDDTIEHAEQTTDETLLTLDEAVRFLDTSKSTLYRLLGLQAIKGVKVGKQWRFRKPDLIAYIERSPVVVAVDTIARADLETELKFFDEQLSELDGSDLTDNAMGQASPESMISDLVNSILFLAFDEGSTDIHVEPTATELMLRYRTDGVLREVRRMPGSLHETVIARLKEMGEMNLVEKRFPQDGRFTMTHRGGGFEIRMSTLPTIYGENAVMRILSRSSVLMGLDRLGIEPAALQALRSRLGRSDGMIIATGPTGSGKTTLLYSCLAEIESVEKKVITIEDPVEYQLEGVTQVQVNNRIGMTFAAGMRSAMRQDPDVIMCGEVRDEETAQVAARAGLTGILVLVALHTGDAPSAILRLAGIGVMQHAISTTVSCVVATRLARRLCPHCKIVNGHEKSLDSTQKAIRLAEQGGYKPPQDAVYYSPVGCSQCHQTGYKGRLGLHEVLVCDHALVSEILKCTSEFHMNALAIGAGMKTLFADGMQKAVLGETSIEEVRRATGAWM